MNGVGFLLSDGDIKLMLLEQLLDRNLLAVLVKALAL